MQLKTLRVHPALAVVMLLCVLVSVPAEAQEEQDSQTTTDQTTTDQTSADQTAADLLQQAVGQFEAGEYEQARQTLQRIDRVQLSDAEKETYDKTQQAITGYLGGKEKLAQAEAAENTNDLQKAKQLYRELTADTNAPRKVRQQALNGLARVERKLMGEAVPSTAPSMQQIPPALPQAAPPGVPMSPQQSQALSDARRLRAQELTAQGQTAAEGGNYNEALRLYQQAIELDPTNEQAAREAQNVKVLLTQDAGRGDVLQTEVTMYKLQRQRAIARYEVAIGEAKQAAAAANYPQASDAVSLAKSILDTNRQFIPEAEYTQLRQQALDLGAQISQQSEQTRVQQLGAEQAAVEQRQLIEREQAEQQKHDKVQELLRRARDLSREQKYEQALEQIQQIKFIDPQNDAAEFMQDLITDQMIQVQYNRAREIEGVEMARARLSIAQDIIPHQELILYPPDWPELSQRRLEGQNQTVDSEVNRVVREKLQQPIPIDFRANRLETVFEYLRNVTNVNFFVQWRALEAAGIARDTPITMQLQNVAAEKAMTLILDEAGGDFVNLGYALDEGVVVIATQEFLASKTEIRLYDIRDLIVDVPDFPGPTFDLGSTGGAGGTGVTATAADEGAADELTRADRIAQIMDTLRNQVDPDNWRESGGTTSSMSELNGTLIVNTTSENHRGIGSLLSQLREQRALQIAVDARFLFVTTNFLEEIGFDVDIEWNDSIPGVIGQPSWQSNYPDPTNLLNPATSRPPRAQRTQISGSLVPETGMADAASAFLFGGGFIPGVGMSPLGFLIDDLQVSLMIRATQMDQRNVLLNTPRVTFFNSQRAYVFISTQTAYVSDLDPVVATGVVAYDTTISVVSDGVALDVQGTISADRRYVTMTVRPSLAQLRRLRDFQAVAVGASTDNDGDGLIDEDPQDGTDNDGDGDIDEDIVDPQIAVATLQVPEIDITEVRSTVSVPDKGTLLIGGQRMLGEIEVQSGTPILSKIPIINRLFTNRAITRDERTLLVLIKPTIIVQSEEEERLFPGLNQSPGLYNVGVRP